MTRRCLRAPAAQATVPKGRGTAWSILHRFDRVQRSGFEDGWGADSGAEQGPGEVTEVREELAREILAANDSPDIPFELSVNPYRGCEHGCIYCYARPTHGYLDLSPGLDFETRLVAKVNAAERLRQALSSPSYRPKQLCIGSATDAYQPVERRLRITRGILEVLHEASHPFLLITKSSGVERDLDLIAPMAARQLAAVTVTVTTLEPALARAMEPRAPSPARRLRTVETLARAGVPVGISISPMIPFLNEPELERLLRAGRDAGARAAWMVVLRLPWEVRPLFQDWLERHYPQRSTRVMARIREMRGGRDNDARFESRMTGQGVWADLLRQRFEKACGRLGLARVSPVLDLTQFRRPRADLRQAELF